MSKSERTRRALGSWRLYTAIAYFFLVAVIVALYVQNGRIIAAVNGANRAETLRVAAIQADADGAYRQCVDSIPTLTEANRFVSGVQELHAVLVENAVAAHRATPPGSPFYRSQEKSIARLRSSKRLVDGLRFPVPSRSHCALARSRILAEIGRGSIR